MKLLTQKYAQFKPTKTIRKGFSLLEMLIVVAIVGILTALVIPIGRRQIVQQEINGSTQLFINAWQYARSEAIRRNQTVTFCALNASAPDQCVVGSGTTNVSQTASSANFGNGWAVFVGEVSAANLVIPTGLNLLRRESSLGTRIQLITNQADPIGNLTIRRGGLGLPEAPTYVGLAVSPENRPTDGSDYLWRRTCFGLNGESSATDTVYGLCKAKVEPKFK